MKLNNEDVQDILRLLDASPYSELHLQTDQFKLSLRRAGEGQWTQSAEVLSKPNLIKSPSVVAEAASAPGDPRTDTTLRQGLIDVRTPLPGTFYRSPQPGAPAFVEVGSQVEENTVVCIVETMKLMNSIHAGEPGRIEEICLENGQFIEQDTVLMRIEPRQR